MLQSNKNNNNNRIIGQIIMSTCELPLLEPVSEFKASRRQSVLSNYDPSAYPPDLDFAAKHGLAQRVGQYIPPKEDVERCPCCLQPINKPALPLGCDLRDLLHIGCAYPLYLLFIKQCMVLIGVNLLICSLPSLVINLHQGNMCVVLDGLVYSFYGLICKSSVINIMNVTEIDMLEVQGVLNFVAICVSIVLVALMDIQMTRQYQHYYDEYYILPKVSDYSVVVKGLPKDITISQIHEFLSHKMGEYGCSDLGIHKIYLIYNLKTYYSLYSNKRAVLEQLIVQEKKHEDLRRRINDLDGNQPLAERTKLNRYKKDALEQIGELENKKELIEIEINNYEEMFKLLIERITNEQPIDPQLQASAQADQPIPEGDSRTQGLKLSFSGKCIVTLNSKESKEALTEQARNLYFLQRLGYQVGECLGGASSSIVILDAPEPSEIIFANIGSDKMKRWTDSFLITLSLTLLIGLDFVLLTIEKKFIKQEKAINSSNLILSFINSQLIALFNSIVSRVIRVSENKAQMHSTQSSYYYSVTSKLVVLYLINMLVTTFFSNLVNYYLINEKSRTFDRFPLNFEEYLFDIFFLLITNPFVSFFLICFDHRQGYKYYKRHQIEKQAIPVTQAEANLDYENMQIDLSNKYSNIYRFVLFSAGVCFIYPPALLICLLTLLVFYWEDKYFILRRYVIAHKLNFYLTARMQKILWLFPLMMAITNLIIMFVPISDGQAFEEGKYSKAYYYLAVIALVLAGLVYLGGCIWVTAGLQRLFFSPKGTKPKMPDYKDIEMDFEEDYWHYYPYFKVKGEKERAQTGSPRKQRIEELDRKMGMDVFSVIKSHLHHDRYSPIV